MAVIYNSLPPFKCGPPDWWTSLGSFPTKIMDQNFGMELTPSDLKEPFLPGSYSIRRTSECIDGTGFSSVMFADDYFEIQFQTDQIPIEKLVVDFYRDSVVIKGKHGFIQDGDGETFRSFERKYMLPVDVKMGDDSCVSRKDGAIIVRIPWLPGKKPSQDLKKTSDSKKISDSKKPSES